ncbi:MAG: hypothetical protein AABW58_00075 [Nanoarchaeota archaeon]
MTQDYSKKLPEAFKCLKKGDRLKINDKLFTIRYKTTRKEGDHISKNEILYDLGNDYWLNFRYDWTFFKMKEKKVLWGIFGILRKAEYIQIKSIKILK